MTVPAPATAAEAGRLVVHAAGCRRWLTVRRDTSIDAVLEILR